MVANKNRKDPSNKSNQSHNSNDSMDSKKNPYLTSSSYSIEMATKRSVGKWKDENFNNTTSSLLDTKESPLGSADSYFCPRPDGCVKIRNDCSLSGSGSDIVTRPPKTFHTHFATGVKRAPNAPALMYKKQATDQNYECITYLEYYEYSCQAARAFIKLGLDRFKSVGIIGFNSIEWFFANNGAIMAGGFSCGIYTTSTAESIQYVAANCSAQILVVENDAQMKKVLEIRGQLPELKAIIQYRDTPPKGDNIYSWAQFMEMGKNSDNTELKNRISSQRPNQCALLIYTSGTTGNPKGVMLSHDNLTYTADTLARICDCQPQQDVGISYLPLSHIAAQLCDIYLAMATNMLIYFAQPDALKGSIGQTMKEARPTMFLGVPRVWEKIQEKMREIGAANTGLKLKIATWAKSVGFKHGVEKMHDPNATATCGFRLANAIVFNKVKQNLGLDRARMTVSAAAPIMKDTLDYFLSLSIPILEVYGMSECSGPHTVSLPHLFRHGGVGTTPLEFRTNLANPDEDKNGEVCMYGRHVFMGYLNENEKTNETVDSSGYLHSGDIGKFDGRYLYITGRIKELIITAGGENIPPIAVEEKVLAALPCVANAFLVGDKKKFLSMLLSFKSVVDPDTTEPTDELSPVTIRWMKENNLPVITSYKELIERRPEPIMKAIQKGIDEANQKNSSRAQTIQKWALLPKEFSIPGGELGPTLKVRRPIVCKMYNELINGLYQE